MFQYILYKLVLFSFEVLNVLLLLLLLLLPAAVELSLVTLVQTKQIRINTHKRDNTKNTVQILQITQIHILPKHPHITKPRHTPTHTHTYSLQNKLKQPQYKIHPHEIVTI